MLKMVACKALKKKRQFPLWNSRGHQQYALVPSNPPQGNVSSLAAAPSPGC